MYVAIGDWFGDSVAWSEPRLIEPINGGFSYFSWARLGGDTLIVIWHEGDESQGKLKTLLSTDGGSHWKRLESMPGRMAPDPLVVDAAGRVHIVYRGAESPVLNAPGVILHSIWLNGRWSAPDIVSPKESMTSPGAGAASGGRIMATWTEADWTALGPMPKSYISYWTPPVPGRPCH